MISTVASIQLDMPETLYQQWHQQSAEVRTAATQAAIEAISNILTEEAKLAEGRALLQRLPKEAEQFQDTPPHDLASKHDDYLLRP
jgi:hypothetical protein